MTLLPKPLPKGTVGVGKARGNSCSLSCSACIGDGLGIQRGHPYYSAAWNKGVEPAPMLLLTGR